jgi:hypothetical protein
MKEKCCLCDGVCGIFDKVPKWDTDKDGIVWEDDFVCCPNCNGTGMSSNIKFKNIFKDKK